MWFYSEVMGRTDKARDTGRHRELASAGPRLVREIGSNCLVDADGN